MPVIPAARCPRLPPTLASWLFALKGGDCEPLAISALAEMVGALSLARGIDDRRRSKMILKHSRDLLKVRLGV
jgi:TetR/AcrR family transcriptional regulator, transcriptional repressor for nem operon